MKLRCASDACLALGLTAKGELRRRRLDSEILEPGDITVDVEFAGVCGTDMDIIRGSRTDRPDVLGHEATGIIACSRRHHQYVEGRPIVFNPVSQKNQETVLGHTAPGIWRRSVRLRKEQLDAGHAVVLDAPLPGIAGSLTEPLAVALYAFELVCERVDPKFVVVVGGGAIGLMLALEARRRGIERLAILTPSLDRLGWAKSNGLVGEGEGIFISRDPRQAVSETMALASSADAVFICAPRKVGPDIVALGFAIVRSGGVIDLVGGYAEEHHCPDLADVGLNDIRRRNICGLPSPGFFLKAQGTGDKTTHLTGHRGTGARHLQEAARLLHTNPDHFLRIVTHVLPMDTAAASLKLLASGTTRSLNGRHFVKAVLDVRDCG